jgi:hypothetical protein
MPEEPSVADSGGAPEAPGAPAPGSPPAKPPPSRRRRIALITGITAVVLAAAAVAAATLNSSPPGLRYASPRDACQLVTASTLAKYLPGPGFNPQSSAQTANVVGQGNSHFCEWLSVAGYLDVGVYVYGSSADGPTQAQQVFNGSVQANDKDTTANGTRTTTTGKRSVTGLGDQAVALLQTATTLTNGNSEVSDEVLLSIWSGNAEVEILYSEPIPSAAQLPGAIAISHDVLAALPRA